MKKLVMLSLLVFLISIFAGACQPETIVKTVEVPVIETVIVEVEVPVENILPTQAAEAAESKIIDNEIEKPVMIGYNAPILDVYHAGVISSLASSGGEKDWIVLSTVSELDGVKQANQIENFITLGVDAIVAVPIDNQAFCASAKKAIDAGIHVYSIDRAPVGCEINMTIQADNELGGKQSAEAIVSFLKKKNGGPSGVVLELQGDMGQNDAQLLSKGFNDVLAAYDGIEVVSKPTEWEAEKFSQATLEIVGTQDVDAIYAHSDIIGTIPILSALEKLGKKIPVGQTGHIFLASFDGSPQCLEQIRQGFQDQCSSKPDTDFGELLIFIEIELGGGTIDMASSIEEDTPWSQAVIIMSDSGLMLNLPSPNVTTDNVDELTLWGNRKN